MMRNHSSLLLQACILNIPGKKVRRGEIPEPRLPAELIGPSAGLLAVQSRIYKEPSNQSFIENGGRRWLQRQVRRY